MLRKVHLAAALEALPSSNCQCAVLKAAGTLCNRTTTDETAFRETIWNLIDSKSDAVVMQAITDA